VNAVTIVDVGPRDGLQNATAVLAPGLRAELCARMVDAGIPRVEAVSFVDPRRVPQMAGAEEVVTELPELERFCGLVLNDRGYERLVASGLTDIRFTFAASDAFNLRNANATTAQGLATASRVLRDAARRGLSAGVTLATAFGCPFTGDVEASAVVSLAEELAAGGASEVVLADTIGVATPRRVRSIVERCARLGPAIGVHLHNTRNTGYANAYAAIEAGATVVDASIGGLGGCPFAPGATGNIATEDLVHMLERDGIDTGVDLDALIDVALWLSEVSGLALDGHLHRIDRTLEGSRDRAAI
jgi:isopropylmalate/homocitrate/citramalate synthase